MSSSTRWRRTVPNTLKCVKRSTSRFCHRKHKWVYLCSANSCSLVWQSVLLCMIVFYGSPVQVFTCDNPEAFKSIYSPNSQDRAQTLETIADQIVTLCATLDEYPGVRFKKYTHSYSLHICSHYTWCLNGLRIIEFCPVQRFSSRIWKAVGWTCG